MKLYKKGSGWGFVIFIILIFASISILNGGFENFKSEPIEQSIETGKDVVNITKIVIDKTGDVIEIIKEPSDSSNLGQIPCNSDEECDRISECQDNCTCESGFCILN